MSPRVALASPSPGPRDAVVRVAHCGICGSDLGYIGLGGLAGPTPEPMPLGHELSGMFASTDGLRDALTAAGETVGERVWPLPLLPEHKEFMKGVVADLRNISTPAMGAGSTAGAAFLSTFVGEDTEWCHLDIAGTAWNSLARDWVGGPTGSGVGTRLLSQYLETRT